jgi:hypothetical protein
LWFVNCAARTAPTSKKGKNPMSKRTIPATLPERNPQTVRQVFYMLVAAGVIEKTPAEYQRLAREVAIDNDGRPLIILYVGDIDPSGQRFTIEHQRLTREAGAGR